MTSGVLASFVEIESVSLSLPEQTGEVADQNTDNAVRTFGSNSGVVSGTCTTSTIPPAIDEIAAWRGSGNAVTL
jgi:hypothetical protein